MDTKTCRQCGEAKPLGDFYINRQGKTGPIYSYQCKCCARRSSLRYKSDALQHFRRWNRRFYWWKLSHRCPRCGKRFRRTSRAHGDGFCVECIPQRRGRECWPISLEMWAKSLKVERHKQKKKIHNRKWMADNPWRKQANIMAAGARRRRQLRIGSVTHPWQISIPTTWKDAVVLMMRQRVNRLGRALKMCDPWQRKIRNWICNIQSRNKTRNEGNRKKHLREIKADRIQMRIDWAADDA